MNSPGASPADITREIPRIPQERRRAPRHKVRTPAYAHLNGSSQGAILELSEILNLSESGACIQARSQLTVNRLLPMGIELSDTDIQIRTLGHVVWSEPSGKTGIHFPSLEETSRVGLEQWLAAHATSGQEGGLQNAWVGEGEDTLPEPPISAFAFGYTSLIAEWAQIEREVELYGPDLGSALHVIAQRAAMLTWAGGAAIALINPSDPAEMVCWARAGTGSPEIGARLQTGSGFSGECVRTAAILTCHDSEFDSRVDLATCRGQGIRSIAACPVKRRRDVIGILEVFSPEPAAFWENDVHILDRLTGVIERAVRRAERSGIDIRTFRLADSAQISSVARESSAVENVQAVSPPLSLSRKILVLLTGIVWVAAVLWLVDPWIEKLTLTSSSVASASPPAAAHSVPERYIGASFKDLKAPAAAGDAAAQYQLGMRYANGQDVKQDYREALRWLLRAADQGNARAQGRVASWMWAGRGVHQDYSKAYYWALLAQANGDEAGRAIVLSCAPYLSPAQVAAEQKEADNWLHRHHIGQASPESSQ